MNIELERAAFEVAISSPPYNYSTEKFRHYHEGERSRDYTDASINFAWSMWLARAERAALATCQGQDEPGAVLKDLRGYATAMVTICDEALAAAVQAPSVPPEPSDFQLESLFDAVHEHGVFGREFREHARQILAARPTQPSSPKAE